MSSNVISGSTDLRKGTRREGRSCDLDVRNTKQFRSSRRDAARSVRRNEKNNFGAQRGSRLFLASGSLDRKIDIFESRVLTFAASVQCSLAADAHPRSRKPHYGCVRTGRLAASSNATRNSGNQEQPGQKIFKEMVTDENPCRCRVRSKKAA
jgi:hypothetical protein